MKIPYVIVFPTNFSIGIEAGGHGSSSGSSVLSLVSSILSVVPESSPPILAAGGVVNGGHLAALLTLGASGAVFGTRFLLSTESLYSNVQRQAILAASSSSSVRTMAFDYARDTMGWPRGIDGRALHNGSCFVYHRRNKCSFMPCIDTVEDFRNGVDIKTLRARYAEGEGKDDLNRIVVWAGAGVGLMKKIQPAQVSYIFGFLW